MICIDKDENSRVCFELRVKVTELKLNKAQLAISGARGRGALRRGRGPQRELEKPEAKGGRRQTKQSRWFQRFSPGRSIHTQITTRTRGDDELKH